MNTNDFEGVPSINLAQPSLENDGWAAVPIPCLVRATTYAIAWLPCLTLILYMSWTFEPLFARLHDTGELPALTDSILWISRVNRTLGYLPFLIGFGVQLLADLGIANVLRRSQRSPSLYLLWFIIVITAEVLAAALVFLAILLPPFCMNPPA